MTVSVVAKNYQPTAGAPLQFSCVTTIPSAADWAVESDEGVGVKATSAAPTNVSEFGGHVFAANSGDMDSLKQSETFLFRPGDTEIGARVIFEFSKRIDLDANWAVGRYVFAYSLGSAGAVVKASTPYRIR